ncbi:MAG: GatB/YqeY domain-containing protein [Dongiaceae bacterium]
MLRQQLPEALKVAMKARELRAVSTLRLILAALKDRDIAARTKGNTEGLNDDEIVDLLHRMVRQRRESIALFEQGGRLELAQQEAEEITVIERFLPKQLDEGATMAAIDATVAELGASSVKDMGKVMARLKEQYAGQMDFGRASQMVKAKLG